MTMKKLITILVVSANTLSAQSPPSVHIWRVTPDTVCAGDTIKIDFKFDPPTPVTSTQTNSAIYIVPPTQTVFIGNYNQFYSMPKETFYPLGQGDSCYYMKVQVPASLPPGLRQVKGSGGNQDYATFYIKNCSPTNTTTPPVGIEELSLYPETPIYRNMMGNIIEKRYNELIIEQVGNRRRKVMILQNR